MQTTTATRTTTETNVNLSIRYDPTYVRTVPGIIKCACVVSLNFKVVLTSRSLGWSQSV